MRQATASDRLSATIGAWPAPGIRAGGIPACVLAAIASLWGCREAAPPAGMAPADNAGPASALPPPDSAPHDPEAEALKREALAAAAQLSRQFPDDPNAVYMVALVHDQHGDRAEAEACWKRCLELDPRFVRACFCLGQAALERGDYEESAKWLQRALDNDPQSSDAHLLLGKARMGQGRMQDAVAPLQEHIRLSPQSAEGWYSLGQVFLHLQQYEKARSHYQSALRADPDWWNAYSAYYGLAMACRKLGQEEQAREHLRKFTDLKTRREQVLKDQYRDHDDSVYVRKTQAYLLTGMRMVYAGHGRLAEAERLRQRVAELGPTGSPPPDTRQSSYER